MGVESVIIQVQQSEIICLPAWGTFFGGTCHTIGRVVYITGCLHMGVESVIIQVQQSEIICLPAWGTFFGGTCHTIGRVVYITGRFQAGVESVIIQVQQSEIICLPGMGNFLWWDQSLSHHRQGSLHHLPLSHGCGVCNYTSSTIKNCLSPWEGDHSLIGPVTP